MIDSVPEYNHAKFGGNWTTNKGETEGQSLFFTKMAQPDKGLKHQVLTKTHKFHCFWLSTVLIDGHDGNKEMSVLEYNFERQLMWLSLKSQNLVKMS